MVAQFPIQLRVGRPFSRPPAFLFSLATPAGTHAELALKAHGGTLQDIIRTTIYFTDRDATWPILDKVRRELFPDNPPVSTGIGVTKIDLNAALEIEFTAAIGSSK